MMRTRIISALLLTLVAATAAAQQIYRWTDEKGRVHITDTPPPPSAKSVQKKSYQGAPAESGQTSFELSQAVKEFPVTLYTASTCSEPCQDARSVLNRRGVPYKEIQVSDAQTADELKRVSGGEQVPVLVVGRSVHSGFLQSAYDSLLDAARYPKTGSVPARAQAPPDQSEPAQPATEAERPSGPYAPGAPRQRIQKK
jgi:glutaredoxin